ncbi:MAG TPA: tetratricopeptide repeat protein, partial [Rhodanobacteraceae bacterium]|nr:tetratricopeptide repeat protein [Rhodanobacteraceae bacterium]
AQPDALLRASEVRFDAGDFDSAQEYARRAIASAPLDGRAYRELGLIASARGDDAGAATMMRLARRHAPRDIPAHGWLMYRDLHAGDYAGALGHVDFMLRVDRKLRTRLYAGLIGLANGPARPSLAALLGGGPPWRAAFWAQLCRDSPDRARIAALVDALRDAPVPLDHAERAAWLERLVRDGRWAQAYPLWIDLLPADQRGDLADVHDGGFEHPPEDTGFGWRFERIAGARIDRAATAGVHGRHALHVEFEDRRVAFHQVSQLLVLAPGHYRLSGRVRADGLRNERGMQWVIVCVGARSERIASTGRYSGSSPWHAFSTDFDVPDAGCAAQWLRLDLAARIPAEQMAGGGIWFDDLDIARASMPQAATPESAATAGEGGK